MAAADNEVRVIVLKANGPHFSAGHDISASRDRAIVSEIDIANEGLAALYNWERKHYLGFSRKWRDIPKPSIAAVQGACIAGGLHVVLALRSHRRRGQRSVLRPCRAHGYRRGRIPRPRLGVRRPQGEGDALHGVGHRCRRSTSIGHGQPGRAARRTRDPDDGNGQQIAQMHPFALAMAKRAVNQTLDIMGQYVAQQSVFDMHSLAHGNALVAHRLSGHGQSRRDEDLHKKDK